MFRSSPPSPGRSLTRGQRLQRQPPTKINPRARSRSRLLHNSNHRVAEAKTLSSSESEAPNSKSEEEDELFHVDPHHPEQVLRIGTKLPTHEKTRLHEFLSENLDVFAWSPTDMPGVDATIICHNLSIRTKVKPVQQAKTTEDEHRTPPGT